MAPLVSCRLNIVSTWRPWKNIFWSFLFWLCTQIDWNRHWKKCYFKSLSFETCWCCCSLAVLWLSPRAQISLFCSTIVPGTNAWETDAFVLTATAASHADVDTTARGIGINFYPCFISSYFSRQIYSVVAYIEPLKIVGLASVSSILHQLDPRSINWDFVSHYTFSLAK